MMSRCPVIACIALIISCLALPTSLRSQTDSTYEQKYEAAYQKRIQQTHLSGVYIPADLGEAFEQLEKISDPVGLQKFREASEETVAQKLHFGLGKWMTVNWSFYEGSRFSHYLKDKGLSYPDDMAQFVIITFHRYLNEQPLEEEKLIESFREIREKEHRQRTRRDTIFKNG